MGRVAEDDEDGGGFLALHALGVLGVEEVELGLRFLRPLEGVHEADAGEGFVAADLLVEGVLDVHRRHVVGEQHHFVTVQLVPVFVLQPRLRQTADEIDHEVAGADEGIDDVDAGIAERAAKTDERRQDRSLDISIIALLTVSCSFALILVRSISTRHDSVFKSSGGHFMSPRAPASLPEPRRSLLPILPKRRVES